MRNQASEVKHGDFVGWGKDGASFKDDHSFAEPGVAELRFSN